jgi:hypothetical protein
VFPLQRGAMIVVERCMFWSRPVGLELGGGSPAGRNGFRKRTFLSFMRKDVRDGPYRSEPVSYVFLFLMSMKLF